VLALAIAAATVPAASAPAEVARDVAHAAHSPTAASTQRNSVIRLPRGYRI
jgi:hypothetical protein